MKCREGLGATTRARSIFSHFSDAIFGVEWTCNTDSSGSPRTATRNFTSRCNIVSQGSSDVCNSLPTRLRRISMLHSVPILVCVWYQPLFPALCAAHRPGGTTGGSRSESSRPASVTVKPGSSSSYYALLKG